MPNAEVLQRRQKVDVGPIRGFEMKKANGGKGAEAKMTVTTQPKVETVFAAVTPRVDAPKVSVPGLQPTEVASFATTALKGEKKAQTVSDYCYSKTPIC